MRERSTVTPRAFADEKSARALDDDFLDPGGEGRLEHPSDYDDDECRHDTVAEDDYEIQKAFEESFVT